VTVADNIAEWLYGKRITTAFGVIGGGNVYLWDALTRLGKTEIVPCHHEQSSVLAAGAYFRASGKIAVALVTTGAGSTNAITGVASAFMDSTPVLVISGNEATKYMDAKTRVWGVQGYDSSRTADRFVKQSARIGLNDDWRFKFEFCLVQALLPRQGPVWVDVPKDSQNAAV